MLESEAFHSQALNRPHVTGSPWAQKSPKVVFTWESLVAQAGTSREVYNCALPAQGLDGVQSARHHIASPSTGSYASMVSD